MFSSVNNLIRCSKNPKETFTIPFYIYRNLHNFTRVTQLQSGMWMNACFHTQPVKPWAFLKGKHAHTAPASNHFGLVVEVPGKVDMEPWEDGEAGWTEGTAQLTCSTIWCIQRWSGQQGRCNSSSKPRIQLAYKHRWDTLVSRST